MNRAFKRGLALLMLGALLFAQASFAFSSCPLERSALGQSMGSSATMESPCESAIATDWTKYPNRCFGHCTTDLQTVGAAVALVRGPADAPVLAVQAPRVPRAVWGVSEVPHPGAPPLRILFRSFLI